MRRWTIVMLYGTKKLEKIRIRVLTGEDSISVKNFQAHLVSREQKYGK